MTYHTHNPPPPRCHHTVVTDLVRLRVVSIPPGDLSAVLHNIGVTLQSSPRPITRIRRPPPIYFFWDAIIYSLRKTDFQISHGATYVVVAARAADSVHTQVLSYVCTVASHGVTACALGRWKEQYSAIKYCDCQQIPSTLCRANRSDEPGDAGLDAVDDDDRPALGGGSVGDDVAQADHAGAAETDGLGGGVGAEEAGGGVRDAAVELVAADAVQLVGVEAGAGDAGKAAAAAEEGADGDGEQRLPRRARRHDPQRRSGRAQLRQRAVHARLEDAEHGLRRRRPQLRDQRVRRVARDQDAVVVGQQRQQQRQTLGRRRGRVGVVVDRRRRGRRAREIVRRERGREEWRHDRLQRRSHCRRRVGVDDQERALGSGGHDWVVVCGISGGGDAEVGVCSDGVTSTVTGFQVLCTPRASKYRIWCSARGRATMASAVPPVFGTVTCSHSPRDQPERNQSALHPD